MRNRILFTLLFGLNVLGYAYAQETPLKANSVWVGTYDCVQGLTQLKLKILENSAKGIRAVFEFSHAATDAKGSFYLQGNYDPPNRTLKFKAGEWIDRPKGYVTVDMEGKLSENLKHYSGQILFEGCGAFSVDLKEDLERERPALSY